jgi:hypothetical protein
MCCGNKTLPCQRKDALRACRGSAKRKKLIILMAAFIERHKRRAPLWWNFSAASLCSLYIVCIDGCIAFFHPLSSFYFCFSSAPGRTQRALFSLSNKANKRQEKIYTLVHTRCWYLLYFFTLPAAKGDCDSIDGWDLDICVLDWLRGHFWGCSPSIRKTNIC